MKLKAPIVLAALDLADWIERHNAELFYTVNDDGLHLLVDGQEIPLGFAIGKGSADGIRTLVEMGQK